MRTGIRILGICILIPLTFIFGFFQRDIVNGKKPDTSDLTSAFSGNSQQTPTEQFQNHFNYIYSHSAVSTDQEKLRHDAMTGAVASLGDPHTNYLEPSISETFTTETRGDFVGVGARLNPDPLGAKVFSVFQDGPAKKAGLKPGDLITKVNGKVVAGQPLDKIVSQIKGEEGTNVKLTLMRDDADKPIVLNIIRKTVLIPTVEGKVVAGNIGYIRVSGFSEPTAIQFQSAMEDAISKGAKGLVVDLRSNPGGLLGSARDMLSFFFENKTVVSMKGRDTETEKVNTTSGRNLGINLPITVLINEDSASASEIFSGVMQDYGRATIIGEHSYGKASVQDLYPLQGGASLKVTIAKYYLPSGRDISRKVDEEGNYISGGLKPDIEVPLEVNQNTVIGEAGKDSQLDKAIEHLKKQFSF